MMSTPRLRTIFGLLGLGICASANAQTTPTPTVVAISPSQTYQTMTGFGASLTQSGATAIAGLTSAQQTTLMTSLFSSSGKGTGAGISFLRQPMGASDFRTADYTYDDSPAGGTDYGVNSSGYPALSGFSINQDLTPIAGTTTSIMSLLQEAQQLNPKLSVMGSPWTAPGWMKTGTAGNIVAQTGVNQTLYGGTLVDETAATPVYETYAQYFVRYVQAYAAQGIHVSFVTPQNEPFYDGGYAYPSMTLTTAQQVSLITAIGQDFAKELVNPSLAYNAVTNPRIAQYTKIEILDHNWSDAVDSTGTSPSTNITGILGSPVGTSPSSSGYVAPSSAAQYVSGVAFHGYSGSVSAQNVIQSAYPTMQIFFTEQTGSVETTGTVQQNFANDLMYDMENLVVGGTRDWATTITKFNLALNQSSGPKIQTVTFDNGSGNYVTANSGDDNGRGLVTINANGTFSYNEEYYALGQIAKFVEPGAVRIGSNSSESVAFLNPDALKTMVVVAYNNASTSKAFQFQEGSQFFTYTIPTDSVVTFSWASLDVAAGVNVCETTGSMAQLLAEQDIIYFVPEPVGSVILGGIPILLIWRRPRRQRRSLRPGPEMPG